MYTPIPFVPVIFILSFFTVSFVQVVYIPTPLFPTFIIPLFSTFAISVYIAATCLFLFVDSTLILPALLTVIFPGIGPAVPSFLTAANPVPSTILIIPLAVLVIL